MEKDNYEAFMPFTQAEALDPPPPKPPTPQGSRTSFEIAAGVTSSDHVPGFLAVVLDQSKVNDFLEEELSTLMTDSLYPRLRLVAEKAAKKIDPLHANVIKDRAIIPADNPKLHLV